MRTHRTIERRTGTAAVGSSVLNRLVRRLRSTRTDHVAGLYRMGTLALFFIGATLGVLVQTEHLAPTPTILMPGPFYRLLTLHGLTLLFWVLLPAVAAGVGIPRLCDLLGVPDLEWPRLLRASFHAWLLGTLCLGCSLIFGAPDGGIMLRPPLSTTGTWASAVAAVGVGWAAFSAALWSACILRTLQRHRLQGLSWLDWPLLVLTQQCASALTLLAAPVLGLTLWSLALGRATRGGPLDGLGGQGPDWYAHLFWLSARPAIIASALSCLGVLGDVLSVVSKRDLVARRWVNLAVAVAAAVSVLGWGQHLITTNLSVLASTVFSAFGMLLGLPLGVVATALLLSLASLRLRPEAVVIYLHGAAWFLVLGLLSGAASSAMSVNVHLHGTTFVVAHLHCLALGTAWSSWLAGLLHHWPRLYPSLPDPRQVRVGAMLVVLGTTFTVAPGFVLGARGMVRGSYAYPQEFRAMEIVATVASWVLAGGLLLTYFALIAAARRRVPTLARVDASAG